jgi:hypothetical protein
VKTKDPGIAGSFHEEVLETQENVIQGRGGTTEEVDSGYVAHNNGHFEEKLREEEQNMCGKGPLARQVNGQRYSSSLYGYILCTIFPD